MKRLLYVLAVVSLAIPAAATTVRRLTLEQVRDRADSIFVARVVSSSSRPVAHGRLKATDYVLDVAEVLYGFVPHTTTITFAAVDNAPVVEIGRDYVFFRTGQPNNTTVGWRQGLFSVDTATIGGVDRTLLISGDGEALVTANGSLARGQRVTVRNKQVLAAASEGSSEPMSTNGRTEGAGVRRLRPIAKAAARIQAQSFATLDDLRAFVRARQEKP